MVAERIEPNFDITEEEAIEIRLYDSLSTLDTINYQLAQLKRMKEIEESKILEMMEYNPEGQLSQSMGKYKVTIKAGYNYSVNIDEYSAVKGFLSKEFNPVKESVKYEVDKKKLDEARKYASDEELEKLEKFITEKPKKINITLGANA